MDKEYINWDALVNYITGQSSLKEEEMIHEWIKMDPRHEKFIAFLRKIWESSAEARHSWDVDSAWSRFNEEYSLPFSEEKPSVPEKKKIVHAKRRKKGYGWYSWSAVAVSVVIIVAVLFSLDTVTTVDVVVEEPSYREVVTKNGQRTHLNLSDGSSVILNAGTTLTLPVVMAQEGDSTAREVHLIGEAWFEVSPDSTRPFIVYTENAKTRVLGTTFQVTSYPGDGRMQVIVSDGQVAIQDLDKPDEPGKTLTKNQIGVLFDDGLTTISTVTDLSAYMGWTEGNLIFYQDTLERVMVKLERWYDIDVRVDDPALYRADEKKLTASFTENQPIHEVLEAIALTLDLEYRKDKSNSALIFLNKNQYQ